MTRPILLAGDSWAFLHFPHVAAIAPESVFSSVILPGATSVELLNDINAQPGVVLDGCVVLLSLGYGDVEKQGLSSFVALATERALRMRFCALGAQHIIQPTYSLHDELFSTPLKRQTMQDLDCRRTQDAADEPDYTHLWLGHLDPLMTMQADGLHLTLESYRCRTAAFGRELTTRIL